MATTPLTADGLGTILSIWAHPDDETYLAGGLMAAAADAGQRVVCVSATAGERGTDDPHLWPPDRLGYVRRLEAAAAMAVLGVDEHRFLCLPDGGLTEHGERGQALLEQLLDEVRPDTILTFGRDGSTFHPDHIAVHHWVTDTWLRRGQRERLLYAAVTPDLLATFGDRFEECGVYPDARRPTGHAPAELALHLRLTSRALDRKLTALRAMATQTTALQHALGPDVYAAQAADECFVDAGNGAR